MRRTTLTAWEAVQILFPPDTPPESAATAQFRGGADVCEILALHFGFDADDYARLLSLEPDTARLLSLDRDPPDSPLDEGGNVEGSDPPAAPAEPAPAAEPVSPEAQAEQDKVADAFEAVGEALHLTLFAAFAGRGFDSEIRLAWRGVGAKLLTLDE